MTTFEQVASVFKDLGLPPEDFREFIELVESPTAVDAGVDSHLAELLRAFHAHSWASTDGLEKVVHTVTGSRPGDPLGDVPFSLVGGESLEGSHRRAP